MIEPEKIKKWLSVLCACLAVVHIIFPRIGIDFVTVALLVGAALPWALPWVAPFIKSFELPGGYKIELRDTKAATDKLTSAPRIISLEGAVVARSSLTANLTATKAESDPISRLREIAGTDPNLAFVGFRIEVEKRLRDLAEQRGIPNANQPLTRLLKTLEVQERVAPQVASGLAELIALGNRAAHGSRVDAEAVDWLLDVGPSVLSTLDDLLRN